MIIQDVILIVALIGVIVFGFFIMKRLDKFLDENKKRIKENKNEKNSRIMLTSKLSDDEIVKQIRSYEEKYGEIKIEIHHDEENL